LGGLGGEVGCRGIALHIIHYNFAWIYMTMRINPSTVDGLSDHSWSYEDIVGLVG